MDAELARDIERAISTALSRRGVAGTVVVREHVAELHGAGVPVLAIELDWVAQWNVLPSDMQDKRAESAAQRLHEAFRAARGGTIESTIDIVALARKAAPVLLSLAILGGAGWWLWRAGFFGQVAADESEADASAAPPGPGSDVERKRRACEAARRRLYAGADMGMDVDGWVIELWLARQVDRGPLAADAALSRGVERARADFDKDGPAEITVERGERSGALGMESTLLRMRGAFVTAFFDRALRNRIESMSEDLARGAGVAHAALFARCEHLPARDVGTWYFGRDRSAALTSLLYSMGLHSEPPAFDSAALGGSVLPALAERIAKADADKLDGILKGLGARTTENGADAGTDGVTIRFAFGGPMHAVTAARGMAEALDLQR